MGSEMCIRDRDRNSSKFKRGSGIPSFYDGFCAFDFKRTKLCSFVSGGVGFRSRANRILPHRVWAVFHYRIDVDWVPLF